MQHNETIIFIYLSFLNEGILFNQGNIIFRFHAVQGFHLITAEEKAGQAKIEFLLSFRFIKDLLATIHYNPETEYYLDDLPSHMYFSLQWIDGYNVQKKVLPDIFFLLETFRFGLTSFESSPQTKTGS